MTCCWALDWLIPAGCRIDLGGRTLAIPVRNDASDDWHVIPLGVGDNRNECGNRAWFVDAEEVSPATHEPLATDTQQQAVQQSALRIQWWTLTQPYLLCHGSQAAMAGSG